MKAAIFDFDGTLFPHETIPFLIAQYPKMGFSRGRQLVMFLKMLGPLTRYKLLKTIDKETFRHQAVYLFLSLFQGMTREAVEDFFMKNAQVVNGMLDHEIVEEMQRLKSEGYHTVLLSGCFDTLLHGFAYGLGFDEVIGTSLVYDSRDRMDVKNPITIISGREKVNRAGNIGDGAPVDWQNSRAYADSCYDAPVMELVGHKVAVNPDRGLEAMARDKGWSIMTTSMGEAKVRYSE